MSAKEFQWTLGEWQGARSDGAAGADRADVCGEPMTMHVEAILGGAARTRSIEITHDGGTYRGFAVEVFDPSLDRWVRQYVNAVRGRFARYESEGEDSNRRSVWRSASPQRTRESMLVEERGPAGEWIRTLSVSEDDGASWRVLWSDELRRRSR